MPRFFTLLLIIFLISCGGSGSSNPQAPTVESSVNDYSTRSFSEVETEFEQLLNSRYSGATNLAEIQDVTVGDFASAFFHSMDGFVPFSDTNEFVRTKPTEYLTSPFNTANELVKSVISKTAPRYATSRAATKIDETANCEESGTLRMEGTISDEGKGVLDVYYDACTSAGTALDGHGALYIESSHVQKFVAFYDDVKSSSKIETTYITGSMDKGIVNQGSTTFNLVISDINKSSLYKVKDYIITEGTPLRGRGIQVKGELSVPAHGYAIISTRKNYIPNKTNFLESDAEFTFSGAGLPSSILSIVDDQILISLINSNTTETKYAIAGKYDLLETPGFYLPQYRNGTDINWAPTFSSIEFMQTSFDTTHDIKVQLEGLRDVEGNFVEATFQWYLNGEHLKEFNNSMLPSLSTTKGDIVVVVVSLHDGVNNIKVGRLVADIGDGNATIFVQNLPEIILKGQQLTFQVLYGDPDSSSADEKKIALSYGPDGMSISDTGVVTWHVNNYLFRQEQIVRFGFSVQGETLTRHFQIKIVDPEFALPIARTSVDISSAWNSLKAIQFDDDSEEELLIISGKQQLYTLGSYDKGLIQEWMYPYELPGGDIRAATPVDLNSDGISEIVVASQRQISLIRDRNSIAERIFNSGIHSIRAFAAADIDQNGTIEIVIWQGNQLLVVNLNGEIEHQIELDDNRKAGRSQLVIGNTDGDNYKEIILNSGYIFDGASLETQWDNETIFGDSVSIGDFDGDGKSEIIGLFNNSDPMLYDPRAKTSAITFSELKGCFVTALNIDLDAADELVVSCWPHGEVKVFNLAAGRLQQISVVENIEFSLGGFTLVDIDGDSKSELFWAGSKDGFNRFFVADIKNGEATLLSVNQHPKLTKFRAAGIADQRHDSGQAVYIGWDQSFRHSGQTIATLKEGELHISSPVDREFHGNTNGIVVDYDNDSRSDIFMKADNGFEEQLKLLRVENISESELFNLPRSAFTPMRLAAADFNKDGFEDFIAADHNSILVVDIRNKRLMWEHKSLALQTNDIVAGQGYFIYSTQGSLQRWDKIPNGFLKGATENQGCSRLALIRHNTPKENIVCLVNRAFGAPRNSELKFYDVDLHQQQSVEFQFGAREILMMQGEDDQLRFLATYTNSSEFNTTSVVLKMFSMNGFLIWESEPFFGWLSPKSLHRSRGNRANSDISVATDQAMFLIEN